MRIAYYSDENKRKQGAFNVIDTSDCFTLGANKIVINNKMVFWFENQEPYQDMTVNDLVDKLFIEGYLDLRPLKRVDLTREH